MITEWAKKKRRASLHTLGCRLNQSETIIMRDKLQAQGYEVVPFGEEAELAIINTCTVTRQADSKCRQAIRQFIEKNPKGYTAVVGCYSQMGTKEVASIPGVDLILGNQDKLNVLDYIGTGEKNNVPVIVRDRLDRRDFTIQYVGDLPYNQRANLKVQDGCNFMCSFCIIPFARGRARCRAFDNLLDEAYSLAARGVRELVITGVNIGTYDYEGKSIVDIVDALDAISGIDRVRISSIEPTTIPKSLFERMACKSHSLQPFLHIPLQSGSDRILEDMRRKYTLKEYADFIHLAYNAIPDLYLGTDIMVGFPGETEDDFQQTCAFFLNHPFAFCHVFTYSERDNTPAAIRQDHLPMEERHRRSAYLRRLSNQKRYDYYEAFLGKTLPVLFENPKEGMWPGLTENYIRVVAADERDLTNKLAMVRLESQAADFVEGRVVELLG